MFILLLYLSPCLTSCCDDRSRSDRAKFHIISAAHVTHPFLYPRLYPEEFPRFLSFLGESDIKVALQLREFDTGTLLGEFWLRHGLSVKQDSDLVVGHLNDEKSFEEAMAHKYHSNVELLTLNERDVEPSKVVEVIGNDFTMNANGHHVLVPVSISGQIMGASKNRIVIDTPEPTVMGLCGGPVIELDEKGVPTSVVVGMVEGRIQEPTSQSQSSSQQTGNRAMQALVGRTVLVSSVTISEFLTTVEEKLDSAQESEDMNNHAMPLPEMIASQVAIEDMGMPMPPEKLEIWDPNAEHEDSDVDF